MAESKKKKKSPILEGIGERAAHLGLGITGGAVGNQITTWLEKQSFLGGFAPHASTITGLLGAGIYLLVPNQYAQAFGFGMAVTGGTEESEALLGMMQGALGMTPQQRGLGTARTNMLNAGKNKLGFVPQPNSGSQQPNYFNGVPIR